MPNCRTDAAPPPEPTPLPVARLAGPDWTPTAALTRALAELVVRHARREQSRRAAATPAGAEGRAAR